ncbi:hypothetical protein N799_05310 [Lysobacter arseniciresistens ZS79]|uniref:Uncharacterized protein n=2 Tax=Novilysobacter TaxID=3382699 RepID=A0A0A0F4P3_9GAMM|nr:hypothetical protein N799_05310 [Lysobacter arseniciresistens ZS79]
MANGGDIEELNDEGFTPLHMAVMADHLHMVNIIIGVGADIDARENKTSGMTPLHLAAGNGFTEVGLALLEAGADPLLRIDNGAVPGQFNQDGATCIDYAEAASDDKLVAAMHLVVANRQADELAAAWSPSSADADALVPQATGAQQSQQVQRRRL